MGNRETSNHGHFSEQITRVKKMYFTGTISETKQADIKYRMTVY